MSTVKVDLNALADKMIENGVSPEDVANDCFDGWTNSLVDALEELYGLEYMLTKVITKTEE